MAQMPKMRVEVVFNTEHIEQRVARALASYRCQYTRDDDGDALDMVDVLTPLGAADISDGKRELELLAEHITMTVVDDVCAGEDDNKEIAQSNHHCDHCGAPMPGHEENACCGSPEYAEATECGCGGPKERICADCEEQRRLYLGRMETRRMKR